MQCQRFQPGGGDAAAAPVAAVQAMIHYNAVLKAPYMEVNNL